MPPKRQRDHPEKEARPEVAQVRSTQKKPKQAPTPVIRGQLLTLEGRSVVLEHDKWTHVQSVRVRPLIDELGTLTLEHESFSGSDAYKHIEITLDTMHTRQDVLRQAQGSLKTQNRALLTKLEEGNVELMPELQQNLLKIGEHRKQLHTLSAQYQVDVNTTGQIQTTRATLRPGALTKLSFLPESVVWCPQSPSHVREEQSTRSEQVVRTLYIGDIFYHGHGVSQDQLKAKRYYRVGADAGDTYCLGMCHSLGIGVETDSKEANRLFKRAADQGHAGAQTHLGCMYYFGEGVPKDLKEAVRLLKLAVDQGHSEAQVVLGYMHKYGIGVPKNLKERARLFKLAADQGRAYAQVLLGDMYCHGDGVPKDLKEATRLFKLAADQGHTEAHGSIGDMYKYGIPKDSKEAARLLKCVADQRHDANVANVNLETTSKHGRELGDLDHVEDVKEMR